MTNITISNLEPNHADLLMNFDSYITELTDEQIDRTHGGDLGFAFAVGIIVGMLISR